MKCDSCDATLRWYEIVTRDRVCRQCRLLLLYLAEILERFEHEEEAAK